jgi:RimJ/RimL family protein N-acetyltransferase
MPVLETARLFIRPFAPEDLDDIHRILSLAFNGGYDASDTESRARRKRWLDWAVLNYEALANLFQPPYGDRAVVLKASGTLIGAVGFVPDIASFGRVPSLRAELGETHHSPEVGLFWAIDPAHQRQGYAVEAARAMMDYAFTHLNLRRVIATTALENAASQGVMRSAGMRVERLLTPEPSWMQIVGVRENDTY